jgi:uncharacterized protein YbbK (DUF523 family)
MKTYTSTFTKVNIEYWSVNFCIEREGGLTTPREAFEYLKFLIEQEGEEFIDRLEMWGREQEEVENEPDWDMLPGGKDYD